MDLHILSMLFATLDTQWDKNEEDEAQRECCKIREENLKYPQPLIFVLEKLLSIFKSLGNNWEVTEQITEVKCSNLYLIPRSKCSFYSFIGYLWLNAVIH